MSSEEVKIVLTAQDNASAVINNVSKAGESLFQKLGSGLVQGAGFAVTNAIMNGIGQAFSTATDAVIGFNAQMEQSRISWTTMLGSAGQANRMLSDLQQFAIEAGSFEFPQLETGARRLMAMGFQANAVLPTLKAVATAAASQGLGAQGVDRITLALGQMRTTGRVAGDDMRQLTEAGIPGWEILAKAVGRPTSELRKMTEQGQISSDVFIKAFTDTYGPLGEFGHLLDEQAKTFNGAISNMADAVRLRLGRAFEPVFNGVRDLALAVLNFIMQPGFKQWAEDTNAALEAVGTIIKTLATNVDVLKIAAALAAPVIIFLGVAAIQAAAGFLALAASFIIANLPMIALGVAIAGLALIIIASWEDIGPVVQQVAQFMGDRLADFINWAVEAIPQFVADAGEEFSKFGTAVSNMLNFIGEQWAIYQNWVETTNQETMKDVNVQSQAGWGDFVEIAVGALKAVVNAWNGFVDALKSLQDAGLLASSPLLDFLAGKRLNVSEDAWNTFGNNLKQIPDAVGHAWNRLGQFVASDIPTAVSKAVAVLQSGMTAVSSFDLDKMIKELQNKVLPDADVTGKGIGTALGNGMLTAVKPLIEELAKLIAEKLGGPAKEALEDTQYRVKELKDELAVRGLLNPEERQQARAEIRGLSRNVLPGQTLDADRADRAISLADRQLQHANLNNQILQNIRDQAIAAQTAAGTGTGTGTPTGISGTGVTAVGPNGAPVAVGGGPGAAAAAAPKMQININMTMDGGPVTNVFDELIVANGQAVTPPTIPLSAVRRA